MYTCKQLFHCMSTCISIYNVHVCVCTCVCTCVCVCVCVCDNSDMVVNYNVQFIVIHDVHVLP